MRSEFLVIEEPIAVPHVLHRPSKYRLRNGNAILRQVFEVNQSDYALSHAMYINGVLTVMKVPNRSVRFNEMPAIELEAAAC